VKYDFVLADVFSATPFGGNQLAVLPAAQGLTSEQMQSIAREFNFAETVFVFPPEDPAHTHRLRIFSPGQEMPFAGHPTVGAAAVLAHLEGPHSPDQINYIFSEAIGPVRAQVKRHNGQLHSELVLIASLEQPTSEPDIALCAQALTLPTSAVRKAWFASVGLRFCFVQLTDRTDVDAAALNQAAWASTFEHAWTSKLYLFAGDPIDGGELYARMFAPGIGVSEDPATGSAAAALAAHVAVHDRREALTITFKIVQGEKIGRRSEVSARAEKSEEKLPTVTVGGTVTVVGSGSLTF
jgi:trans-2,3-dihydro-3-hydroxyanthranilate isomerase